MEAMVAILAKLMDSPLGQVVGGAVGLVVAAVLFAALRFANDRFKALAKKTPTPIDDELAEAGGRILDAAEGKVDAKLGRRP